MLDPAAARSPRVRSRLIQIAIALIGGVALLLLIGRINHPGEKKHKGGKDEAVPVATTKVVPRDVPVWKSGVGTVQPLEAVDVKARVDGQIVRILFKEGDMVAAGQALAQIDPRPFQALFKQADANKARDLAQLANTKLDLGRAEQLLARGAATNRQVDTLRSQVAALVASVAADQAQLETMRLNLQWSTIRSPIAGRVGLRQVNLGAMVRTLDTTGIVTVTQLSPIAVVFALPQDALPALVGPGSGNTEVMVDDRSGHGLLAHGRLAAVDSQVDSSNGQVKLKARFDNADHRLWPGTLVSARVLATTLPAALTVPADALQQGQAGTFVYVVGKDSKVDERAVQTGPTAGGDVVILSGLHAGETVVASGQSRIAAGSKVTPHPFKPANPA